VRRSLASWDRLDRDVDGSLTIVDYKTGGLPNRKYDSQTFANAELYAALCEAKLGEQPTKIRLMYVAKGESIERNVTDVVVKARSHSAASAWARSTASTTTAISGDPVGERLSLLLVQGPLSRERRRRTGVTRESLSDTDL